MILGVQYLHFGKILSPMCHKHFHLGAKRLESCAYLYNYTQNLADFTGETHLGFSAAWPLLRFRGPLVPFNSDR